MAKYTLNPWLEIQGMKEKMDSLMEEALERFDHSDKHPERLATWCPVADAYETENSFVVQLELAGLHRDEISLEVVNGALWVYGQRKMVRDVTASRYHFLERSYGPFARKFILQDIADPEQIQAVFRNGLLTITIPKGRDCIKSHKINVTEDA